MAVIDASVAASAGGNSYLLVICFCLKFNVKKAAGCLPLDKNYGTENQPVAHFIILVVTLVSIFS